MNDNRESPKASDQGLLREISGYLAWYIILTIVVGLMAVFLRDFSIGLHILSRHGVH